MLVQHKPLIGVLALQGCVEPHHKHIEAAGGVYRPVKTAAEFDAVDAFILPGGESTTMLKLIEVFDLWEPLARNFAAKPVWGICAGAILMAETVMVTPKPSSPRRFEKALEQRGSSEACSIAAHDPDPVRASDAAASRQRDDASIISEQKSFGLLPMTVQRNAYGRQAESHFTMINNYEICFIRAPVITACSKDVEILASYEGAPVWVQQGRYIASSFHAELNLAAPSTMHQHFVRLAAQHKQAAA